MMLADDMYACRLGALLAISLAKANFGTFFEKVELIINNAIAMKINL